MVYSDPCFDLTFVLTFVKSSLLTKRNFWRKLCARLTFFVKLRVERKTTGLYYFNTFTQI